MNGELRHTLTRAQARFLADRPDDCVIEALMARGFSEDEASETVDLVAWALRCQTLPTTDDASNAGVNFEAVRAAVYDMTNGSTVVAQADARGARFAGIAAKTAQSVEMIVSAWYGSRVEVPIW